MQNMDAATRNGGVSAIVEYDYTAKESDELDLVKGAIINNIKQMPGGWWEGTLQSNGKTGMFPDNFVRIIDANDENTVTLREKSAIHNRRCKVIYSYTQVNDDELSLAVGDVIEFLGEVEEGWWRGRLKNKTGVFPSNFVIAIEPSPILASKRPPSTKMNIVGGASAGIASANAVAVVAAASNASAASSLSTKKTNRLSFHNSKEDLLGSTNSLTTASATSTFALDELAAPILPPKPQRDYCRVEFPYAPQNDDELELKIGDVITVISMELPDKGWWKGELRGKVGVFPDNFVKLLASSEVSPLNEPQQAQRTAKNIAANNTATAASANSSNTASNITVSGAAAAAAATTTATSKVFIKKTSGSSTTSSHIATTTTTTANRKESFGSRDSLNDILSETGLQSGNVATQRKSLENKNLDLSNAPDASTRLGLKKQQHMQETKNLLQNNNSSTTTTTTTTIMSANSSASDLRKSVESLDDKTKTTPPPVLTKKPSVPSKKSGNIISGFKQKVKNAVSHDSADGVGSSKMSPSGLPDSAPSGNVVMRRAATIAVEDSDFDRVERASILSDMRAGRVKAPKRRPPSAAINVIGESNNNNSIYLNGSSGSAGSVDQLLLQAGDDGKPQSSDDNSAGDEPQLAKPKPREWEKKKMPWMEELKASQVQKKKISPSVEPRTTGIGSSVAERTSKLYAEETKSTSNHSTSNTTTSSSSISSSSSSSVTTKVQSSSISSSRVMQQSMLADSRRIGDITTTAGGTDLMARSMAASTSISDSPSTTAAAATSTATTLDDVRTRPNSLSIRNSSISSSPMSARAAALKTTTNTAAAASVSPATATTTSTSNNNVSVEEATTSNNVSTVTSTVAKTTIVNNHNHHQQQQQQQIHSSSNNIAAPTSTTNTNLHENNMSKADCSTNGTDKIRIIELERRLDKFESIVQAQQRTIEAQQRTIDELVRMQREDNDRVKVLRGELDKYAQCVTQV